MTRFFAIVSPVTLVSLLVLWCTASNAAEPSKAYKRATVGALVARMPVGAHGECRITEKLVTSPDGSQHIARHLVCTGR